MTTKYDLHLDGVRALDLPLALLREVIDFIVDGAARSARLAGEGRSTARGSAPAWLADAADVHLIGFREGSLALDVTARPLSEIAPTVFPLEGQATAVDFLIEAVDDAAHGRRDSERLDAGVLQILASARSLFARGSIRLRFAGPVRSVELTAAVVEQFQALADATPAAKVDRVLGILDSLTISTRTCLLKMIDGSSLRGYLAGHVALEPLRELLGTEVVLEGTVAFAPSGRPQRIEVDHAARARVGDIVWKRIPHGSLPHEQLALPTGDIGTIIGRWPGDEDDARILAALAEIS